MGNRNHGEHAWTYWRPAKAAIEGKEAGGLQSVLLEEFNRRRAKIVEGVGLDKLVFITDDTKSEMIDEAGLEIRAVRQVEAGTDGSFGSCVPVWFSYEWAAVLHPDAFSSVTQCDQALAETFTKGGYTTQLGSFDRIVDHYALHGLSIDEMRRRGRLFNDRFSPLISTLPNGSTVNWSFHFFSEAMLRHGPNIRENGGYQTFHHHFPLPAQAALTERGRLMVNAIAKVDDAFFHTDEDKRNYEEIVEKLNSQGKGLRMPNLHVYRLGIDRRTLRDGLDQIGPDNYRTELAEPYTSDPDKARLLDEVMRTRDTVPHRFISVDRLDPIKGVGIILDAIEKFLDEKAEAGMSLGQMQSEYRFFFVHESPSPDPLADVNLLLQYGSNHVVPKRKKLEDKYPGVIFSCGSLPRKAMGPVMKGCHYMCASTQEGLNLATQEGAWVNDGLPYTSITATGAGFAKQTIADGFQELGFFPKAGSVDEFADAIRTLTSMDPDAIRAMNGELVDKVINRRRDSVIVARP